jgi:hypothetical protein
VCVVEGHTPCQAPCTEEMWHYFGLQMPTSRAWQLGMVIVVLALLSRGHPPTLWSFEKQVSTFQEGENKQAALHTNSSSWSRGPHSPDTSSCSALPWTSVPGHHGLLPSLLVYFLHSLSFYPLQVSPPVLCALPWHHIVGNSIPDARLSFPTGLLVYLHVTLTRTETPLVQSLSSLMDTQHLEHSVTHSKCSINTYWVGSLCLSVEQIRESGKKQSRKHKGLV